MRVSDIPLSQKRSFVLRKGTKVLYYCQWPREAAGAPEVTKKDCVIEETDVLSWIPRADMAVIQVISKLPPNHMNYTAMSFEITDNELVRL